MQNTTVSPAGAGENFTTKSAFVAIVGKPNVGKSSLLNAYIGEKIAIVTAKAQTTRTRITGVLTKGANQLVFLDTPGIHAPKTKLGQRMVKATTDSIADVDVAVMMFEVTGALTPAENSLIESIKQKKLPAIGAVNKVDLLKNKADLLPRLEMLYKTGAFKSLHPVSVHTGSGMEELLTEIESYAKPGPHYFDEDSITDMPEKAIVAEMVREKLLTNMYEEIPHGTAVVVESFKERENGGLIDIGINIYCEKKSHKGMIIGKGGAMLKKIGSEARADIEAFLGTRVNLECWVKVKDEWRDSDFLLNNFGFQK